MLITGCSRDKGSKALENKASESANPFNGKPDAVKEGGELYRGMCSGCHGGAGRGGKCPDLTDDIWIHGGTDTDLFHTISKGAAGTEMRNFDGGLKPDEIWKIIAYVRTLAASGGESAWNEYKDGDAKRGKSLFYEIKGNGQCYRCHMVEGEGGRLGPDLSRVAAKRTPQYIWESIIAPNADIVQGYQQFTITTTDNREIEGYMKNEDNFSMQMITKDEEMVSLDKMEIAMVSTNKTSPMPGNFSELLSKKDLHDLMSYLKTLTGKKPAAQ